MADYKISFTKKGTKVYRDSAGHFIKKPEMFEESAWQGVSLQELEKAVWARENELSSKGLKSPYGNKLAIMQTFDLSETTRRAMMKDYLSDDKTTVSGLRKYNNTIEDTTNQIIADNPNILKEIESRNILEGKSAKDVLRNFLQDWDEMKNTKGGANYALYGDESNVSNINMALRNDNYTEITSEELADYINNYYNGTDLKFGHTFFMGKGNARVSDATAYYTLREMRHEQLKAQGKYLRKEK